LKSTVGDRCGDGGRRRGDPGEQMSLVRCFQTPIVAKGRTVVAGDDQLVVFTTR
jgi:hypothetical protein